MGIVFRSLINGETLRMVVENHQLCGTDMTIYYALRGILKGNGRVRRSITKYAECNVYLCLKTPQGKLFSYWDVWHRAKHLKRRRSDVMETPDFSTVTDKLLD